MGLCIVMDSEAHTGEVRLVKIENRIHPNPELQYVNHFFDISDDISELRLIFKYNNEGTNTLYISLHDPEGFRGNRMKPGQKGQVDLELRISHHDSGPGALPGELLPGRWRVQVDVASLTATQEYNVEIYGKKKAYRNPPFVLDTSDRILLREEKYYKGELHSHSDESDGKYPVAEVVKEAERLGLDFIALSDHITVSQWARLQRLQTSSIAFLHSCEITSRHGHANLHNIHKWVNVFTDGPDWNMNMAADEVHRQGGLFCVNHAFSGGRLGFRSFYFDWRKADLMEIYHNLEGCNNQPMISYWDHLLLQGFQIVGVGGTDSHDPFTGMHKLGQCLTYVFTNELSENGITRGLRTGNVFVGKEAQMRFNVIDEQGMVYEMGEKVMSRGQLTLSIKAFCSEKVRAFIIRDGLLLDSIELDNHPGRWCEKQFTTSAEGALYFRIELHASSPNYTESQYPGLFWRDHESMRAYSNPIFIEPKATVSPL